MLVKRKSIHYLKAIVSGLLSMVMYIMLPPDQANTMALLFDCWRRLLLPEIEIDVRDSSIVVPSPQQDID